MVHNVELLMPRGQFLDFGHDFCCIGLSLSIERQCTSVLDFWTGEHWKPSTQLEGIPQIQIHQLRNIVSHLYELDNNTPFEPSLYSMYEDIVQVIKSGGHGIGKGSQFTCRQLLTQPDWETGDG